MDKTQARAVLRPFADPDHFYIREFVNEGLAYTDFFHEVHALRWGHLRDKDGALFEELSELWLWMSDQYPGSHELWEEENRKGVRAE